MKSSCIQTTLKNRYIQIYEWQIDFCEGNHCSAMLLSFFIGWHDWKICHDDYYRRANDIAEMHGDDRSHSEDAYLFFSVEELIKGCLGFYGKNAINDALKYLESMNVISIHKNPNPRYHFDKTKYFKFYPDICNDWLKELYLNKRKSVAEVVDSKDRSKEDDASIKKGLRLDESEVINFKDQPKKADAFPDLERPSIEMGRPTSEKGRYIKNYTTNNTTKDFNHSLNARENFFEQSQPNHDLKNVQLVIKTLVDKGMPEKHFCYSDVIPSIQKLQSQGALVTDFVEAYDAALLITKDRGFGFRYLEKIVMDRLQQAKRSKRDYSQPPPMDDDFDSKEYVSDLRNLYWMDDKDEQNDQQQ